MSVSALERQHTISFSQANAAQPQNLNEYARLEYESRHDGSNTHTQTQKVTSDYLTFANS